MIYNYSVVKGYQMILGDGFGHLALLMITLIYVEVPDGLGTTIHMELNRLYWMQVMIHFLLLLLFVM